MSSGPAPSLPPRPKRSSFVSILAWLGIVSGALTALGLFALVFTRPSITVVVGFLSGVATLATSIGLRGRREWARLGFIGVLVYSTLMGFVGAARLRMPDLSRFGAPSGIGAEQFEGLEPTLRATALAGALLIGLFNLLLLLKLNTRAVREEFGAEPDA